jgi:hypothetical protein
MKERFREAASCPNNKDERNVPEGVDLMKLL